MSFGAPVDVGTRPHVCRGMPSDAFVGAVYLVTYLVTYLRLTVTEGTLGNITVPKNFQFDV